MSRPIRRPIRRDIAAPRPAWLWALLLCLAMLGSQGLGLLHRVAHPQAGQAMAWLQAGTPAAAFTADSFAGHQENSAQCRLFDQLCQADGLSTASFGFTAAAPQGLPATAALPSASLAPLWRARARGPPAHA
jgi:hypothetical protein